MGQSIGGDPQLTEPRMAFDENLADRIRTALGRKKGIEEKKMFGGLGFLLHGNMLVGVWKNSMIVRLGPDETEAALLEPHVSVFDITGKAMKGWAMVAAEGVADEAAVKTWVQRATTFVSKLPAK
jgi:TfoX/Sxy family transcriptional regulator of competence genes